MARRALLVGIDVYDHFDDLYNGLNDVAALEPLLRRNEDGKLNFSCEVLTGRVTREDLLEGCTRLFAPGADIALLYFSGHGATRDGSDVTLCTAEGRGHTLGAHLSEILRLATASVIPEKVLILETCYSGSGSMPGPQQTLPHGVTILAASRGDQAAMAGEGRGQFSQRLCDALAGGASNISGLITAAGLYAYLDESFGAFGPRPVLRANVDRLQALRKCRPAISDAELHHLAELFTNEEGVLALDPSFEPSEEPHDPDNEAAFSVLQKARDAKLVEPIIHEHLYWEAMRKGSCRLTPLGRHYRARAREGLL